MKTLGSPSLLKSAALLVRARLDGIFIWPLFTAVTCLIVGKGFPPLIPTIMIVMSIFFIAVSVYLYNDISRARAKGDLAMRAKTPGGRSR